MNSEKILVLDNSEKSKEKLLLLIDNISDFKVDVPSSFDEAKELFSNNEYKFVIIEHNCKKSNEFMTFALEKLPMQKMILLSDSLNCPIDCDTCVSKFRFVRLLKPISTASIFKYLVNFKDDDFICPNKYKFDNIDTIDKLYEFIYLEENYFFTQKEIKDDVLFIKTRLKGTLRFDELVKIEDYVNKKYFNLKVTEDNTILITKI